MARTNRYKPTDKQQANKKSVKKVKRVKMNVNEY